MNAYKSFTFQARRLRKMGEENLLIALYFRNVRWNDITHLESRPFQPGTVLETKVGKL